MSVFNKAAFFTSYDKYHSTGFYHKRYPSPNRHVLDFITRHLGNKAGHVVDFGSGSGRYAIPLLAEHPLRLTAFDISPSALVALQERGDDFVRQGRLTTVGGTLADLAHHLDAQPPVDLAMLMFGVLGHIYPRAERVATLKALADRLAPGGTLIATVPNARRRFAREQREWKANPAAADGEPGDIRYRRTHGKETLDLYYHLYSLPEFISELEAAGLSVTAVSAESMLPERPVVTSAAMQMLDAGLRAVLPVSLAYGFMAAARRRT